MTNDKISLNQKMNFIWFLVNNLTNTKSKNGLVFHDHRMGTTAAKQCFK